MLSDADKEEEFIVSLKGFDNYAEKLKAYRKKNKLTQEQLAEIIGVKHVTLRAWEQKNAKPPYNVWRLYKHLFDDIVI